MLDFASGPVDARKDAVGWFHENFIWLHGVNYNPSDGYGASLTTDLGEEDFPDGLQKMFCDLYIDDRAVGTPLLSDPEDPDKKMVDWYRLYHDYLKPKKE